MAPHNNNSHKIILFIIAIFVLLTGVILFFIPPSLFTDPAQGFQVLRSMLLGSSFNNIESPDQGDISQNYTQFLTWWSPGQYLAPYFFKLVSGANWGQGIAITTTLAEFCGLAGFYCFFKKLGFTPIIAALSLAFIICQEAFMIPHFYYNGGEILLFSFEGWFLYGCLTLTKPGLKLLLFVLLSGFFGFFLKSSFLWMYAAGLLCLWIRLSENKPNIFAWLKNALWTGIPAAVSLAIIYLTFISKGESPVTTSNGLTINAATFSFPLASPILAGFSVDDLLNGLMDHIRKPMFGEQWSMVILIIAAALSVLLVISIFRYVPNQNCRLFLLVFYVVSILFFGFSYMRQLNISMESRHFRIIGLLIAPGVIYLVSEFKRPVYKLLFVLVLTGIAFQSFSYLIHGYKINSSVARGITGIAQPNIDQPSLNQVMKLDKQKRGATFVFIGDDIGLEIWHNRFIALQPIGDDLKIKIDDYRYEGHAGPLYIILSESYNGPKEKMVMKCFPGYKGFMVSMLSKDFVLYEAK